MVILENRWGRVEVQPQGAQVLSYRPRGERDLLWVSPLADRGPGRPLRGGIPLCVPWFGSPHPGKGSHGFGRTRLWDAGEPVQNPDGTHVIFRLEDDAESRRLWPVPFLWEHEVILGSSLTLIFRAWNRGTEPAPFELVWHGYFATEALAAVRISGLEGRRYRDRNRRNQEGWNQGTFSFDGPVDLVFPEVSDEQRVREGALGFSVTSDAPGAVVWNPGTADASISDLGPGTHQQYFCLERGELGRQGLLLHPGQGFERRMTITGQRVDFSSLRE